MIKFTHSGERTTILTQGANEGSKYQSDNWYAAFKIPQQKTIRRSLKTKIQDEAERLAEQLFFELQQRAERGLSLSSKQFTLVANSYIKDLEEKVEDNSSLSHLQKTYKPALLLHKRLIVDKYLNPYFDGLDIQKITEQKIINYEFWRKSYWLKGPGADLTEIEYIRDGKRVRRPKTSREQKEPSWNTINKELTVLRQIFEFARRSEIIEGREIPTIQNIRKPPNAKTRKPGINESELLSLLSTIKDKYKSQKNQKHKKSHKLLLHYISFLCLTGVRVTEAKNIKIKDCRKFTNNGIEYLKVFVQGKGKSRELVAQHEAIITLDKLIYFHQKNAGQNGWEYSEETHLFTDQYGNPIGSFAKSLNNALKDANLLYDIHGDKRSAGTFRKYYITQSILIGDINLAELAKNVGNSINVIEQHYADITPTERPATFTFEHALSDIYKDNPAKKFTQ